jgi:hypothetical protein
MPLISTYCPACAQRTTMDGKRFTIAPGSAEWRCPECETLWRVEVSFYEVEEPDTQRDTSGD